MPNNDHKNNNSENLPFGDDSVGDLDDSRWDKDGDGIADKTEEGIKPQLEPKYDSFQEAYREEESLLKGVGSWITETAHGRNTIGRGTGIVLDVAGLVFPPIENIRRKGKKVLRLDERKFKYQPKTGDDMKFLKEVKRRLKQPSGKAVLTVVAVVAAYFGADINAEMLGEVLVSIIQGLSAVIAGAVTLYEMFRDEDKPKKQ